MRDRFLDALRAGSLVVVVCWHWFGVTLDPSTYSTHPISSAPGVWLASWLLQVMPVFFYVGGCLHRRAYRPGYVVARVTGLLRLVAPLLAGWAVIGAVLAALGGASWAWETVSFALSPLWFLAVYLMLVVLLPVAMWLHRLLGARALLLLGLVAVVVDVLRLALGVPGVGWVNLVVVWLLAHQAGFFHSRLVAARRRVGYGLFLGGVLALTALVTVFGYPGWLVGVSGEKWSNMSPPTVAIVALIALQTGLIRLAAPVAERVLATPVAGRMLGQLNRYGMPVYLFHLSALLLSVVVGWAVALIALAAVVYATARRRPGRPTITTTARGLPNTPGRVPESKIATTAEGARLILQLCSAQIGAYRNKKASTTARSTGAWGANRRDEPDRVAQRHHRSSGSAAADLDPRVPRLGGVAGPHELPVAGAVDQGPGGDAGGRHQFQHRPRRARTVAVTSTSWPVRSMSPMPAVRPSAVAVRSSVTPAEPAR